MKPGDKVSKGQLLMTVEGMKMEVRQKITTRVHT